MRILPPPYEGLHPAFPATPDPYTFNPLSSGALIGGSIGLTLAPFSRLFKRPGLGSSVASYIGIAVFGFGVMGEWARDRSARIYLNTKGIEVPRRRLFVSTGDYTLEDCSLLGMALGLVFASARRPSNPLWILPRFGGAMCFGAVGGTIAGGLSRPLEELKQAREDMDRARTTASYYTEEVKSAMRNTFDQAPESDHAGNAAKSLFPDLSVLSRQSGSWLRRGDDQSEEASPASMPEQQSQRMPHNSSRSPQQLPDYPFGTPEEGADPDHDDPQPHISYMNNHGYREFVPGRNYDWSLDDRGDDAMKKHVEDIRQQRVSCSKEAELLWHEIALQEADLINTDHADAIKAERVSRLEVMNTVHSQLWLRIGQLDWMLANSDKMKLQHEARKQHKSWLPPTPRNAAAIMPTRTLEYYEELQQGFEEQTQYLHELTEALSEMRNNGPMTEDPTHTIKEAERVLELEGARNRVVQKLVAEARERVKKREP